ncbi:hypothetical protein GCM10010909_06980 [Acidocella aquatica]|uniref:PRC-barrel domain-containing protein n=1 Tax=Acidocella aquatica TaxID=1922313 RepID=A0ABQ6A7I1_9PROT|nr:PRC-barrel domain-containing protein [Acidocella aquatica]GLR66020.1 hypothetical protein GCM10010909_06980 [Acidocella aquatica]
MREQLISRILDSAHDLISSARIEGTRVYNRQDELLGALHSVMLNKRTGKVAYAVMLLEQPAGAAVAAHPLPWLMLKYSEQKTAYVIDLSHEVLAKAPRFSLDEHDRPRTISEADLHNFYQYNDAPEGALELPIEPGDFNAQTI